MTLDARRALTAAAVLALFSFGDPATAQDDIVFDRGTFEEQVLAYTPVQRDGVTDDAFSNGEFFLTQTKSAVGNNPENFNVAHYWNVAVAFLMLGEPSENIATAFQAAIEDDLDGVCEYLDAMGRGSRFEAEIPEVVLPLMASCAARPSSERAVDWDRYIADHGLNPQLVRDIVDILDDDQRFRRPLDDRQDALDTANQARIDALFAEHGTYIGRTLVGEDLEDVMFLVIQHSNLEYMERYLPHVQAAVQNGELAVTPLKMLIDRVYWLREGYQVFGSQGSVPLADETTRRRIIETYQVPDSD
jgi:hypothetical protein